MKLIIIGEIYQRGRWPWSLWRVYAADSRTKEIKLKHKFIKNVHWIGSWYDFEKTFK